jgi:ribosome-associated protein
MACIVPLYGFERKALAGSGTIGYNFAMPIDISPRISIPDEQLTERFIRASGPGGQNVNKVSTAVELRFDLAHSPNVPDDVRARAMRIAGHRLTQDGEVVIKAQQFRSQDRNRDAAREQLRAILVAALHVDKPRRATKPTYSSQVKRMDRKTVRARVKQGRGRVRGED